MISGGGARGGAERERDSGPLMSRSVERSQRGSDDSDVAAREPASERRLDCYLAIRGTERPRFERPGESLAHVRRQGDERLDHADPGDGKKAASGTASVGTTSARSS